MQAESDTILNVSLHTLKDLTRNLDGIDNSAETGGKENNIGSGLSGFGSTFNSNTAVRLLERGRIIDTTRDC
jgi:hypothetical protein